MRGWIALDRGIVFHWVWYDTKALKWWLDLVIQAAWKDCEVRFLGQRVSLKRGQLVTSMRRLARRWDAGDVRTAKRCLEDFVLDKMVTVEKEGDVTIVTITNYDKYQLDKFRSGKFVDDEVEDDSHGMKSTSELDEDFPEFVGEHNEEAEDFDEESEEFSDNDENKKDEDMHHELHHGIHHERTIYNKTKNNISLTNALARENKYFEKLRDSEMFTKKTMEALKVTKAELHKRHKEFYKEMQIKSFEHKNFNDYKRHFYDWLKKTIQDGKRNAKNKRNSAGRGTKAKAKPENSGGTQSIPQAAGKPTDTRGEAQEGYGETGASASDNPLSRAKIRKAETDG